MKVKRLQKMKFKKTTISKINQTTSILLKGGTRPGSTDLLGNSGQATHCADVVCY